MNKEQWKKEKERLEKIIKVREDNIKENEECIERDKMHLKEHESMEKFTS